MFTLYQVSMVYTEFNSEVGAIIIPILEMRKLHLQTNLNCIL